MAERDRTAVHVDPLLVEAELADHGETLRRERLVELDEVDRRQRNAGAFEEAADGGDGADPHDARIDAGDGGADERRERLDAQLARTLLARDDDRGGAVVDPAGVAGGDRPALAEDRLQAGQLLRARARTRVLVAGELGERDELVGEAAGGVGGRPALLGAE